MTIVGLTTTGDMNGTALTDSGLCQRHYTPENAARAREQARVHIGSFEPEVLEHAKSGAFFDCTGALECFVCKSASRPHRTS